MNETKKTLIFCAVGLVLAGTAWALYPKADTATVETREGSLLFEGFTDPKSVTFLEIQKPSDQVQNVAQILVIGKPERLALAQQPSGNWVVASREDYPAGVMDRVAEAAAALADLRIIAIESENAAEAGDHETFGVIDPLGSSVDPATTGIGLRITAKGGDKTLADLIIGKSVEGQTDVRYVRKPGGDVVYTAKIKDYSRLTTRFDDWIETRVLDVNSSFDIRRATIHDDTYALEQETIQRRHKIDLTYDNDKSQWHANRLLKWDPKAEDYVPAELAPTEELNTQKLNDLTFGLSDLKVVDVQRKDSEIAKSINRDTGEVKLSGLPEGRPAILGRGTGFYAVRMPKYPITVFCAGGELTFATKDGLEYWVRFGSPAGLGDKKADAKEKTDKPDTVKKPDAKKDESGKKDDATDKSEDDAKLNRFMFVTVRFNEAMLERPKLEQEPGELPKDESPKKGDAGKKESAPSGEKPAAPSAGKKETSPKAPSQTEKKPDVKAPPANPKSAAPRPEASKPEAGKPEAGKPEAGKSSQTVDAPTVRLVNYQADDAKKADEAKKADPPKEQDKPAEKARDKVPDKAREKKADDKKSPPAADSKDDEAKKKTDEAKKADEAKKNIEDERKRIKEENDRKIKEYDEKLAKGRKRAKDLNDRFADWFYVISEDSYKKLHLTRDDVVKKKEEKKEDDKSKESPTIDPKKFEDKLD